MGIAQWSVIARVRLHSHHSVVDSLLCNQFCPSGGIRNHAKDRTLRLNRMITLRFHDCA